MSELDPYVYPGGSTLINRFGIKDENQLNLLEAELTAARAGAALPQADISAEGYRAIHKHLFQDIYPWAGEYRTCEIRKPLWFEEHKNVGARMEKQFSQLNGEDNLRGLKPKQFAERAAEHLCELNDIHPFRDGNGRTNRLFAQALAEQAGHRLRMSLIKRDEWMKASIIGFQRNDYEPMAKLVRSAVTPLHRERDLGRSR